MYNIDQKWNQFVYNNVPIVNCLTDLYRLKFEKRYVISEKTTNLIKELSNSLSNEKQGE